MRCPNCDQKPMNCDCTAAERKLPCIEDRLEKLEAKVSGKPDFWIPYHDQHGTCIPDYGSTCSEEDCWAKFLGTQWRERVENRHERVEKKRTEGWRIRPVKFVYLDE